MRPLLTPLLVSLALGAAAQAESLRLTVVDGAGDPVPFAAVGRVADGGGATADLDGRVELVLPRGYPVRVRVSSVGYGTLDTTLAAAPGAALVLRAAAYGLDDVVVTGTLAPALRTESPVPVEVYTRAFLLADPTPSLFEAMQNVNGVRPQLNCAVCNTGDIHVNGLEGPYTMVTIDGMPIVSGLATVYGLLGIPTAMIERVEVVKGPAGTLYGSEAVGGLINVVTRDAARAPRLAADALATGLGDLTVDAGVAAALGPHARVLTSASAYVFDRAVDANGDGFTDQTLARRLGVFQKWDFAGGALGGLSVAARALAESRWGGEVGFDPDVDRGGGVRYGEAIDTRRAELLARYDVPAVEGLGAQVSANVHEQRSDYGTTAYDADQAIAFAQVTYARPLRGGHHLLLGAATRYTRYDDDSFATADATTGANRPDRVTLPGAFAQHEWVRGRLRVLTGLRYDRDPRHGGIWTPRLAVKLPAGEGANLRVNFGTGFRVVNLFTEEHAALSGARDVVIAEDLDPERSASVNLNYVRTWYPRAERSWSLEASTWTTRFSNRILPDYLSDPAEIRYANLAGHALSRGASAEVRVGAGARWRASAGVTFADVAVVEGGTRERPLLSERWSGVWSAAYALPGERWSLDYAASLYGPMLLPVQGPLDPRPGESPWFSPQSLRVAWRPPAARGTWEVYGGVKNLLDVTPDAGAIARSFDPFDRDVTFDATGAPVATPDNPGALVFDPSYVYASNVGRRVFAGMRYTLR